MECALDLEGKVSEQPACPDTIILRQSIKRRMKQHLLLGIHPDSKERATPARGHPYIVQVFGQTEEAIVKYIEYIGEVCDAPFLIDSTSGDARVAGAQYADESGLRRFPEELFSRHVEIRIPFLRLHTHSP